MRIKGEVPIRGKRKVTMVGGSRGITIPVHINGYETGTCVKVYLLPDGSLRVKPTASPPSGK
jgi:hypothetical protein